MKFVCAIDSYKGSLTSMQAGNAAKRGILRAFPDAEVTVMPIADGGEGTVETLAEGMDGEICTTSVTGPLGGAVESRFLVVDGGATCVMEMASAAGITLVKEGELDPLRATSYGVGETILAAAEKGCRSFIIGIGGSATNDGGCGMLQALGARFADKNGKEIPFGGGALGDIESIDVSGINPVVKECTFNIACDVTNPLCGPEGASAVYGPQKGADSRTVELLDSNLAHFADLTKKALGKDFSYLPGSGAAGGLGFAFASYLNGRLSKGIELILDLINIDRELDGADCLITGEGRIDFQTAMGKAPIGAAKRAKKYGLKTIAVAGSASIDSAECNGFGIDAVFSISNGPMTLEEAMEKERAEDNLSFTVDQLVRLFGR